MQRAKNSATAQTARSPRGSGAMLAALNADLEAAIDHHQAGRLDHAAKAYRKIILRHPNHPDALHLLGVVRMQAGDFGEAEKLIRRAISINDKAAPFFFQPRRCA